MWTLKLTNYHGWYIESFGVISSRYDVFDYNTYNDPQELFWIALTCYDDYKEDMANRTISSGVKHNRAIIKELIKRNIPFTIEYIISYDTPMEQNAIYYETFIDYMVVVKDVKYAILCKLIWG